MKKIIIISLVLICQFPLIIVGQNTSENPEAQRLLDKSKANFFIENKGQWPKEVRYLASIGGMNAWITNSGVVYDYYQITGNFCHDQIRNLPLNQKDEIARENTNIKGNVVKMILEGANINAESNPRGIQESYYNYFIGNNPTKWASYVKLCNEVLFEDVYPGIDIRYYFDKGLIRYDYIAKPGADISQINLKITGSEGYNINKRGELTLNTSLGDVEHGKLYAYQQLGNIQYEISCSFSKTIDGNVGITAGNYNPALALVIDPLIYSTFIGGGNDDYGLSIAIDGSGNTLISGNTLSTNYPTTTGAYDLNNNGGTQTGDVFVTKLNANGSVLIYSTFIGGNDDDAGSSISIDVNGNAFIAGNTLSTNYPVTSGAYDVSHNGNNDVFVTKLNATGSALIYSTFIGGSNDDFGYSIVIDKIGNGFITGNTLSSNYPTTTGAYDISYNGNYDLFVTKLDISGSDLVYSTFIGGSSDDKGLSIAIDTNGNSFITGYTSSGSYPTTTGAFDVSYNGSYDAFVSKLNATGSSLLYSTFIGGGNDDRGASIAIDIRGNAFITGYAASCPTTTGAYDVSNNGSFDVFVSKLNTSGSKLVYSTYIGGSTDDRGQAIAIADSCAIVTGITISSNYPATIGSYDTNYGGTWDVFVSKLNASGSSLVYSTFIEGSTTEEAGSLVIDGMGNVIIAGYTMSTDYPITSGAYKTTQSGDYDAFVTKILPINQAVNILFSNITGTNVTCKWTKGGGGKRAVFIKQSTTDIPFPVNGTTYSANNSFGIGSQIGTSGWYCVYNDVGSVVTISGLTPNSVYKVMVCEYIGLSGSEIYNTDSVRNNPVNFTTINIVPTIQAYNVIISNCAQNSFTATWNNGNGSSRTVFICAGSKGVASPADKRTYFANSNFGSGSQIGNTGWYCVYNGNGNSVNISGLTSDSVYRLMVCEYNGVSFDELYNTNTSSLNPRNYYPTPTIQANNILFSNVTVNSMKISWSNGNGTKRVVFVRSGNTGIVSPINDSTYTPNPIFGFGSQVGSSGWYCVYNGSGSNVTISGLAAISTFRVMVCEYNGIANNESYNINTSTNNPSNNQTTDYTVPTIQASDINFSSLMAYSFLVYCSKGNGSKRVIFIKETISGNATPINNTSYTANPAFGSGSQISTSGWYCVYNDTGTTVTISNLLQTTTYRIMVCEYNGIHGMEKYNTTTSANNPANQITDFLNPTIQASNIYFSNISASNVDIKFTRGNGSACLVLITTGVTPTPPLQDHTSYAAFSQVGSSGWLCIFNGTSNSTSFAGSHPATFRTMVCEYNGTAGMEKYLSDTATHNPYTFNGVSINDKITSEFKIYPNPTTGQLVIENAKGYNITVFNPMGGSIFNNYVIENSFITDLNNFPDGIYLLKLEKSGNIINQKIILKR
jgi:hypothetical protein